MKEKLISVVVPVYKVEDYLEKCANSILNQTYKNVELILVDDGSPDKSPEICDKIAKQDKRVKVIHKQNAGVSAARNDGMKAATGDFIAFIDSDDWIEPEMYENLLNKQQENDYDIVFCGFNMIIDGVCFKVDEVERENFSKNYDISYMLKHENFKSRKNNVIKSSNIQCFNVRFLYKREVLENIWFNEQLNFREDVIFLMNIFTKSNLKIACIDGCYYNYLIRNNSLSRGKDINLFDKYNKYLTEFEAVIKNTQYKNLIDAEKFFAYLVVTLNNIRCKQSFGKDNIKIWNTKTGYKENKNLNCGLAMNIKDFLVHHNMLWIFKILYKVKK